MQIVTLSSDFGNQQHHIAGIKGHILQQLPSAHIIDLSHQASPYNLQQAAYLVHAGFRHFPEGSFHFLFHHLHASQSTQLLYAYEFGHHFFCPDNGLITMLFHNKAIQLFKLVDFTRTFRFPQIAELYAHATKAMLNGDRTVIEPVDVQQIIIRKPQTAFYQNNILNGQVLYIDHYGNVVVNITQNEFDLYGQGRPFVIHFMRDDEIKTIHESYHDVPVSEKVCVFNTAGYLEIAINQGSAAKLFGFTESTERSLFYNQIHIYFE